MAFISSNRSIDISTVSTDIIDLSSRIGREEGLALAAGYLPCPIAPRIDAGEIDLNDFIDSQQALRVMRVNLDGIYRHFDVLKADCSSIANEDVRRIFEQQIKSLHEKRGALDAALRSFDTLLKAHRELIAVSEVVESEAEWVQAYQKGELPIEKAQDIRERLNELPAQVNFIRPLFKNDGPEFCQTHFRKKIDLSNRVAELKMRLNLKELAWRKVTDPFPQSKEKIQNDVFLEKETQEKLSQKAVDKLDEVGLSVQLGPQMQPSTALEKEPCEKLAKAIPVSERKNSVIREKLHEVDPFLQLGEQIQSKPVKTLKEMKQWIKTIKSESRLGEEAREKLARVVLESAEQNGLPLDKPFGVYHHIWLLAHKKDSNAGGDHFGKIHAPKDLERLISAISQSEIKRPLMEGDLAAAVKAAKDPIKSLVDLKRSLSDLSANKQFKASEIEQLCSALLTSAEKNGIKLDQHQGVYYWVWFLAHEKDPNAGGDNFGKIQAPKDLSRLLEAVNRANAS